MNLVDSPWVTAHCPPKGQGLVRLRYQTFRQQNGAKLTPAEMSPYTFDICSVMLPQPQFQTVNYWPETCHRTRFVPGEAPTLTPVDLGWCHRVQCRCQCRASDTKQRHSPDSLPLVTMSIVTSWQAVVMVEWDGCTASTQPMCVDRRQAVNLPQTV